MGVFASGLDVDANEQLELLFMLPMERSVMVPEIMVGGVLSGIKLFRNEESSTG